MAQSQITEFDPRAADEAYRSFPSFNEWSRVRVDTTRWERYVERLRSLPEAENEQHLRNALRIVRRFAAVQTGAVEKLYEADRGFTFTIAMEMALWESALNERGEEVSAMISSQLDAYDYVLDFATGKTPIAEAWIRQLHSRICSGQKTYKAYTEQGLQNLELYLGEYKKLPNHVRTTEGTIHSYAPVDLTSAEMHRFCEQISSKEFENAHPVLQSSYAHYALVVIHPFSDGNGRVARALGSIYTYRAESIPVLVFSEDRKEYYDSLEKADNGEPQALVDFTLDRCLNAIGLVEQSLRDASAPDLDAQVQKIATLYKTSGGYTHEEVDKAGQELINALHNEFGILTDETKKKADNIDGNLNIRAKPYHISEEKYRLMTDGNGLILRFILSTKPPVSADVVREFYLEIPKDCGNKDDLIIRDQITSELVPARVDEILPSPRASLRARLNIFADRMIKEQIKALAEKAMTISRNL